MRIGTRNTLAARPGAPRMRLWTAAWLQGWTRINMVLQIDDRSKKWRSAKIDGEKAYAREQARQKRSRRCVRNSGRENINGEEKRINISGHQLRRIWRSIMKESGYHLTADIETKA
jgi:hypothetical protein